MREQTFERHPLDSRVLLSENITDIQRIDGSSFKAGIVRGVADEIIKRDLLSIPANAPYLMRPVAPFPSADKAPAAIRQDLSVHTLTRLSEITALFSGRAEGRDVVLIFSRNLGTQKRLSLRLHFEGINPNGPSMDRDFRGNLSVAEDDHTQMCWVPTEGMTEDDVKSILSPTAEKKPAYQVEHMDSGDFIALHGLDYQHSNLVRDGLLHSGPEPHDRVTVLWGVTHRSI